MSLKMKMQEKKIEIENEEVVDDGDDDGADDCTLRTVTFLGKVR